MEVKTFIPQSLQLRNCIECIYSVHHKRGETTKYISFPSVYTNLSFILHAESFSAKESIVLKGSTDNRIESIIRINLFSPCKVEYSDEIVEITVFFKPGGICFFPSLNHFRFPVDEFCFFDRESAWSKFIGNLLSEDFSDVKLMNRLEVFFNEQYVAFDHPFIFKAIQLVEETDYPISQIAKTLSISRKTLCKHFEKYLRVSPSTMKRITRLRRTFKEKQQSEHAGASLTSIAHLSDYFDQSHMIRDFKALTGYQPKVFFKTMHPQLNSAVNWIFV